MARLILSLLTFLSSHALQASESEFPTSWNSQPATSSSWRLLDVDYFDMRAAKFVENRDPLTPDIPMHNYRGRVATDFQLRILEVGYWKNWIHTEGTDAALRTVGWQWELGIRITDQLAIFHEHHSRHRMDDHIPDYNGNGRPDKFPVEDSYGLRLRFYVNDRPQRSLLD